MTVALKDKELIDDFVEVWLEFSLELRSRNGFNETLYNKMVKLLEVLALSWKGEDLVPRRLMNVLVDIQPTMLASAYLYERDTKNFIDERAINLGCCIREVVSL